MKIALINKKGGVGKSTLALLLTMALRKGGHGVELRDYDAQGTAAQAMARWANTAAPSGVGHLIFDSPPSLTLPSTLAAIDTADLILVPTTSAPFDYWEADKSATFAVERNRKAKVRMILNKSRRQSSLTKAFLKQTDTRPVPVLSQHLGDRPCYQHASVLGWEAHESRGHRRTPDLHHQHPRFMTKTSSTNALLEQLAQAKPAGDSHPTTEMEHANMATSQPANLSGTPQKAASGCSKGIWLRLDEM